MLACHYRAFTVVKIDAVTKTYNYNLINLKMFESNKKESNYLLLSSL